LIRFGADAHYYRVHPVEDAMPYELRRQDFYTGLILCAVSLGVIFESWRMPRELLGWPAYAGPGIVTGLLGLGLLGLAITLLIRAWRRPGAGLIISLVEVRNYLTDPRTLRLGIMCLLSAGYLLILGRGIPYAFTTVCYLILTMLLFRATAWWAILVISIVTTAAIAFVFNRIFLIPLP
jgi:Tripartite tricarboxylate transporter TctB family